MTCTVLHIGLSYNLHVYQQSWLLCVWAKMCSHNVFYSVWGKGMPSQNYPNWCTMLACSANCKPHAYSALYPSTCMVVVSDCPGFHFGVMHHSALKLGEQTLLLPGWLLHAFYQMCSTLVACHKHLGFTLLYMCTIGSSRSCAYNLCDLVSKLLQYTMTPHACTTAACQIMRLHSIRYTGGVSCFTLVCRCITTTCM